jgi:hypothetical protein
LRSGRRPACTGKPGGCRFEPKPIRRRTLAPIVRSRVSDPLRGSKMVARRYLLSFSRSLAAMCLALRMRNF